MSEPPIPPPDNPTPHESEPDEPRADPAADLGHHPARLWWRSALRARRSRHAVQRWPLPTARVEVWRVLVVAFFGGVLGGVSVDAVIVAVIW